MVGDVLLEVVILLFGETPAIAWFKGNTGSSNASGNPGLYCVACKCSDDRALVAEAATDLVL